MWIQELLQCSVVEPVCTAPIEPGVAVLEPGVTPVKREAAALDKIFIGSRGLFYFKLRFFASTHCNVLLQCIVCECDIIALVGLVALAGQ